MNIKTDKNYYEILGVTPDSEFVEVKTAYRKLARKYHPDINKAPDSIKKFKDIQVAFGKVFKELFGGGKGTLTLVDEDDLLETGIMINAQPPGKKLQNMMQLSGGEKSLTAISLLFAIQSLKPSPFCILDEIDAALDEVIVRKYAFYLKNFVDTTQFILVTHRRGTMELANVLYGVTMQQNGISKLLKMNQVDIPDELAQ